MSSPDPNQPPPYGGTPPGQPGYGAQPQGYGAPGGYPSAPAGYGGPTGGPMPFPVAVQTVLSKYADFSGRARRSEYWWFFLFNFLLSIVASVLDAVLGIPLFQIVVALALLIPGLAVGVRRLHDTGRSGWWLLIALVPLIGFIVLIVFLCTDSEPRPNRYGAPPKAVAFGY